MGKQVKQGRKPTAHILIGAPGCGKSTLAARLAEEGAVVVSSDAIRAELYGDEAVQDNPAAVFDIFYQRVREAVAAGRDVVLDATNTTRGMRGRDRAKAELGESARYVAHFFDLPLETVLERNASRARQVPEKAVRRIHERCVPPQEGEFDVVRRYGA